MSDGSVTVAAALHVVKLDLVMPASRPLSRSAKQDASIVMPGVPHVHLHFEIAILRERGKVAVAIREEHASERLKAWLAV